MRQYEIRWLALPLPAGRRPVLLLSRTPAYDYLEHVLVAEITTVVRGIPQEVMLGKREGLRQACVANLDNVRLLRKCLLGARIGALGLLRHREVKRAVGYALDWTELKLA
jgi:mRNA-degrading endonuclease toxin of MazEF toxin-antitoxin module